MTRKFSKLHFVQALFYEKMQIYAQVVKVISK